MSVPNSPRAYHTHHLLLERRVTHPREKPDFVDPLLQKKKTHTHTHKRPFNRKTIPPTIPPFFPSTSPHFPVHLSLSLFPPSHPHPSRCRPVQLSSKPVPAHTLRACARPSRTFPAHRLAGARSSRSFPSRFQRSCSAIGRRERAQSAQHRHHHHHHESVHDWATVRRSRERKRLRDGSEEGRFGD